MWGAEMERAGWKMEAEHRWGLTSEASCYHSLGESRSAPGPDLKKVTRNQIYRIGFCLTSVFLA